MPDSWQPIESAPQGSAVLGYWDGGELFDAPRTVCPFIGIAVWSKPERWPDVSESYRWRWKGDHLNFGAGEPDYWMPLPDPPPDRLRGSD